MDFDLLEARYVRGYTVWLRFRDGTAGETDLGPLLCGDAFDALRDPGLFRQFYVHPEWVTLVWPNGADFAPESLYTRVRGTTANSPAARKLRQWRGWARKIPVTLFAPHRARLGPVTEISRFRGISVRMWHREHGPPHFHARYRGAQISIAIETLEMRGTFPVWAARSVEEWARLHRTELLENWRRAENLETLLPIAPLD